MLDVHHVTCGAVGAVLQQQRGGHMTNFWQIYIQSSRIITCLQRFEFILGKFLRTQGKLGCEKAGLEKKKGVAWWIQSTARVT